ncbi:hypothetical protein [Pandoraea sp. SD6-2]|uniref:hypothetical protein n=1 Tax=Pandoraea sp. SD6-2 TaxID=1286093 RepID=UPI00032DF891|nr:hypothetical protein [Pandoraea sp. SD6-2]EON11727.1 malate/L-lactate dehydrogenase family protein [Pandoraea sp. SD6-2]
MQIGLWTPPSFQQGERSPGVGLFIVAIDPAALAPDLPDRLAAQAERLCDKGIYVAGRGETLDHVTLSSSVLSAIERYARVPIGTAR